LAHHLSRRLGIEQRSEPDPEQVVVIDDQHADPSRIALKRVDA
jgi:hypothetical protein